MISRTSGPSVAAAQARQRAQVPAAPRRSASADRKQPSAAADRRDRQRVVHDARFGVGAGGGQQRAAIAASTGDRTVTFASCA
jgi:hypothetical protein